MTNSASLLPFLRITEADWLAVDLQLNAEKNSPQHRQAQIDKLARQENQIRELIGENK